MTTRQNPRVPRRSTDLSEAGRLLEAAVRSGISQRRLEIAVHAAQVLSQAEFEVVEELLTLTTAGISPERRSALCQGLVQALESLQEAESTDPLAEVDDPLDSREALETLYHSTKESRAVREQLLQDSISVAEAAELTGRSRQALERQRRSGRLLALRRRNQWRYPRWQFDPDMPGGVVPGLAEILKALGLSPVGAAFWLSQPREELDGQPPVVLLHQRRTEPVLALAREQGHML